jgi:hypothetical protein
VEKKIRANQQARASRVTAQHFSIARSDAPENGVAKTNAGIVIQIRLKNPRAAAASKLLSRKNTEFWLTADHHVDE